jgi:hypothetical protein
MNVPQQQEWTKTLVTKPDFDQCMRRIEAWFNQAVIDRPPIRFSAHNEEYGAARVLQGRSWPDLKSRWFDSAYQIELFRESLRGQQFLAETFPVFWPNLGPEVYAAFYGGDLVFGEVTSYYQATVHEWADAERLTLDWKNPYLTRLEEMTRLALEVCEDQFLVGYSDFHAGVDCAAAWRDPEQFCMDLIVSPGEAKTLIQKASADFQKVYDHFDRILKAHGQLSVTWMGIPTFGKMHIPSCDFAALISSKHFLEFCLPVTLAEVKPMTHNIFHVDGKGVAKNLDALLDIQEIQAIQYVQGVGDDQPILQWLPQLRKIRNAGKSLVIDLQLNELEPFISEMRPEGIFLCLDVEPELQPVVMKRVAKW